MDKSKVAALVLVGLALGGVAGAAAVEKRSASSQAATPSALGSALRPPMIVPRAQTPIEVDGEFGEAAWTKGAIFRTGAFGERPYSDARMAWRDGTLYLVLYAADEDLRATDAKHDEPLWLADSFSVAFRNGDSEYVIDVSPAGVLTDVSRAHGVSDKSWESGAKIALDRDGTLNISTDNDEEWVVEMAVPLKSLGLAGTPGERLGITIERCDLSRGSTKRACAVWGDKKTAIELGP
jgi:hypothetical protein